jgi:hypothetical protein
VKHSQPTCPKSGTSKPIERLAKLFQGDQLQAVPQCLMECWCWWTVAVLASPSVHNQGHREFDLKSSSMYLIPARWPLWCSASVLPESLVGSEMGSRYTVGMNLSRRAGTRSILVPGCAAATPLRTENQAQLANTGSRRDCSGPFESPRIGGLLRIGSTVVVSATDRWMLLFHVKHLHSYGGIRDSPE